MSTLREARELAGAVKFKIHAITSVNGAGRSANNNVFYNTYEEALDKVREYMTKQDGCGGFVIMKTCAIIKHTTPPIAHYMVRDSGIIEELN